MTDYRSILKTLGTSSKEDIYLDLMKNEKKILDAANKIAYASASDATSTSLFENLSVVEIIALFANHMKNLFTEICVEHNFKHVFDQKDRKLYIGILLILIALILFVVEYM